MSVDDDEIVRLQGAGEDLSDEQLILLTSRLNGRVRLTDEERADGNYSLAAVVLLEARWQAEAADPLAGFIDILLWTRCRSSPKATQVLEKILAKAVDAAARAGANKTVQASDPTCRECRRLRAVLDERRRGEDVTDVRFSFETSDEGLQVYVTGPSEFEFAAMWMALASTIE